MRRHIKGISKRAVITPEGRNIKIWLHSVVVDTKKRGKIHRYQISGRYYIDVIYDKIIDKDKPNKSINLYHQGTGYPIWYQTWDGSKTMEHYASLILRRCITHQIQRSL